MAAIQIEPLELNILAPPSASATHLKQSSDGDAYPETTRTLESRDEVQYPSGIAFWTPITCMVTVIIFICMDSTMVGTAVPAITDHFQTVTDIGWYSSAYRLCACAFQFIFGKMYTLFPIRPVFLSAIAIFLAGTVLSTSAPTSMAFVIARALAGVGAAGVLQGCFTTLTYLVPLRRRSVFTGILSAADSISSMASPSIGGAIISHISWRWCFGMNIPIGFLAFVVIGLTLKVDNGSRARNLSWKQTIEELDIFGNLLFIPSLCCLFLAFSWAGTKYSWSSAIVIGLLVAFAGSILLYALHERRRGDAATLPLRVLKNRSVFAAAVWMLCANTNGIFLEYYMPTYFQVVREQSAIRSGLLMLPVLLGFLSSVLLGGSGISLVGYYVPFMWLGTLLMPISAGLMTTWTVTTAMSRIVGYSFLLGFGVGIGAQGPQTAVQTVLPKADIPLGIAVVLFAQNIGPAIAMAIGQTIMTSTLVSNFRRLDQAVTVEQINQLGLSQLPTLLLPSQRIDALMAINASLMQTWYLPVGLACATLVGSALIEWKSVKEKHS